MNMSCSSVASNFFAPDRRSHSFVLRNSPHHVEYLLFPLCVSVFVYPDGIFVGGVGEEEVGMGE